MSNPLFQQMGGQTAQNPMQMLQQIKSNPAAVLKQAGLNIPDGMNDPRQIINHLMQSGQVQNSRLQMAQQMLSQMGRR